MKKILHIQLLPVLTGVQNVMLQILDALDRDQYEIYVACRPNGPLVHELQKRKISFLPLNSFHRHFSLTDFYVFIQLLFYLTKYNFDIVHTHSSKPGFLGRIASKICGVKKIIHTHHGLPYHCYQPLMIQYVYKKLMQFSSFFGHYDVFVNNQHRIECIQERVVREEKAITIFNGVALSLKERKFLERKACIVGGAFRFENQKNVDQLIQYCIRFVQHEDNPKVRFKFIGDGEYLASLKKLVSDRNLTSYIQLPGWGKTDDLLATIDVFLLYSRWEGLPLSILEAMRFGLPIIASDIPGNNELVVDGKNGYLVALDSYQDFEKKIKKIMKKETLKQFGEESQKMIKETFSLKKFEEKYLEIYARKNT